MIDSMGSEKAREIAEGFLEITGKALLSGDYESFVACFHLPHTIETPDQKTVLKTDAAFRRVFDRVCEDYRTRGVTDLIRICDVAEFRGPHRIESTHTAHLMSGSYRVVEPYPSFAVIERFGERWLITSSQYAVDQRTTVGRALSMGGLDLFDTTRTAPAAHGAPSKREN